MKKVLRGPSSFSFSKKLLQATSLFLLIIFLVASQASAQQIQASALRQIQSLMDEKASRTPAQQKISSQILYAYKMRTGQRLTAEVATLETGVEKDADGRIKVDMDATVTTQLLEELKALGSEIIFSSEKFGNVVAKIPLDKAEQIAALDAVKHINYWVPPVHNGNLSNHLDNYKTISAADFDRIKIPMKRKDEPFFNSKYYPDFATRAGNVRKQLRSALKQIEYDGKNDFFAGSVTSEGDITHKAAHARSVFGVNGSGVKIGVISDSYDTRSTGTNASDDIASGDLPGPGNPNGFTTPVTVLLDFANGTDEGRAMLQIVHDLAPGAQLYFATANVSQASFAQQILDLRTAGCDIIVDDVNYFAEGVFQDDNVAQSVNAVTALGALYFSSAGNSGNEDDNTSGVWEGDFVDGGVPTAPIPLTGNLHNFSGGTLYNILTLDGRVTLKWSDPLGLSGNDYDLFATNSAGTSLVAASTSIQNGNDNPYEDIGNRIAGQRIYILRKTGAATRALHLNSNRGTLTFHTPGVVYGHNAAASAITVAATPVAGPFPATFNTANKVELFSSDGPRRIFYNPNGTEIIAGNVLFGTNGGTLLQKPDITAADGVVTTLPGGSGLNPFFGTSAAAPHAAAIAALIKSKIPSLTAAQIRTALTSSAIDIEGPGVDRDAGAGIIMAYEALIAAGATECSHPTITAPNVTQPVCPAPGTIVVNATGSGTLEYRLNDGPYQLSPTFNNLTYGNYFITVRVQGGDPNCIGYYSGNPVVITDPVEYTTNGILGTAPPGGTNGNLAIRLFRGGVVGTCAPNTFPGTSSAGTYLYNTHNISNTSNSPVCVKVTLTLNVLGTATTNMQVAAFLAPFVAADITNSSKYLGDPGLSVSAVNSPSTFHATIPANTSVDIVVFSVNVSPQSQGTQYSLVVNGLPCPPTITTTGTLTPFTACAGTASAEQTFTVAGSNLTSNLTVTAPTGFEVSTSSGTGFGTSITPLVPSGGTVNTTTIYVRMAASAIGTPSGNIACASTGATTKNVAASGTVNNPPAINLPTITQPTCATPTGTIAVNATGSGTLEYSVDNGSNWSLNATFGSLAPGSYNIKARLQASPTCVSTYASNPVVLVAATGCCVAPNITTPTITQPTCATPTGTIVVNATGSGTLEYSVDNGSNWSVNATFSGLASGSYGIKVRLQSSPTCISTYASNPVVLNAATGCCVAPNITTPTVTQPTCATPTGTIIVNATGSGTLEYSIDNGSNWSLNATFSGLAPDSYNIKVRLQASPTCLSTYASNPVVLTAATGCCVAPNITTPTVTQPTCATPTGTIVVNATGSGTLEYSIDNGSNWSLNATFGSLAPNSYNIKVRLQASPTCISTYASNPVVLTAATGCCVAPDITTPTVTQPTCATPTGTIVVNATGSGTLEYSVDNGSNWSLNATFSGLAPNSYNIKVRLQASPTCLSTYASNPIVLTAATGCCVAPNITAPTVTQPSCATPTGTIVVNATGSGTLEYQLNTGAFQVSNTFSGLAPGNYNITVRLQSSPTCLSTYSGNPVVLNAATGCCSPATLTVINNNDAGAGSLRQAVIDACPGSTIVFSGVTSPITLTTGEIEINKNLIITGPGANLLSVSGNNNSRVFLIRGDVTVNINNLTVTGGNGASSLVGNGWGGAIYNGGAVSINNTLTLTNCTVSGNTAVTRGGGIYNGGVVANNNILNLVNSTVSNNSVTGASSIGGGIYNGDGTTSITNSTISTNTANIASGGLGGGIYNNGAGVLNVASTTITSNTATNGGGIFNNAGSNTFPKNNIIAGNTASIGPDFSGTAGSAGTNLVGKTDGSTGWVASDLKGTIASPLDPLLSSLANNGGPTMTHALLPGSPAINAGTNTSAPATDQRGIARPKQTTVDIGAFESQGFIMTISSGSPQSQSTTVNTAFANPLSVIVVSSFSEPVNGGKVIFTPPPSGPSCTIAGSPATITSGTATTGTVTANATAGGPYTVTASASGASDFNFSLTNTPVASGAPTTTTLSSIPNPSCFGSTVTFTATVTSSGNPVTTGTVNFTEGATPLASNVALNGSGQATFSTGSLSATSHTITATYNGTASFITSNGSTTQTVNPLPAITVNAPAVTQPGCATGLGSITVNATGSGTLEYSIDNGTNWQLNSNFPNLAAGNYNIKVRFQGGSCSVAYSSNPVVLNSPSCPGKTIPGRIEAESFDAKNGPQYAVATGDPQGGVQHLVGIVNGSWMDYNVLVLQNGQYNVSFRVATTQNNPQFQIKLGATVLGTVSIPNTGGWNTWQNVTVNNIALTAGPKTIRIQSINNETCNFNWTDWVLAGANTAPTANAGPNQTVVFPPTSTVTLAGSGAANNGGTITSHVWSKFSGPAGGNITDVNNYNSTVTSLQVGTYVFRLTVTDNDGTAATSDVTIVVNPASGKFIPGRVEAESFDAKSGPQYAVPTSDAGGGQHVAGLTNGSWLDYNVNVTQAGAYTVTFRVATTQNSSQFQIKQGAAVLATVNIPNSSGWDNWINVPVTGVQLIGTGTQTIRIQLSSNESCNFNWMDWQLTGAATAPSVTASVDQPVITLPTNQVTLSGSGTPNNGGSIINHVWTKFSGPAGESITNPGNYSTTVTNLSAGTYVFRLTVTQNDNQTASADVTVTVNPASGGGPAGKVIAGKIEAEAWDAKNGPQYAVPTSDAGGGQQVIGMTNGSWLDYNVTVTQTGSYTVNFRIATTQNNVQLQVKAGATVLGTINIPNTGGWDTWQTVALNNIALTAGPQTIRIQQSSNESCNFNWTNWVFGAPAIAPLTIAVAKQPAEQDIKQSGLNVSVYPNPASSYFNLEVQTMSMEIITVRIIDIAGRQVQQLQGIPGQRIRFGDKIVNGTYFVEVRQGSERVVTKVVKQ